MAAAEPTPKGHHAGTDVDFDGDGNVKLKIFAQNADEARLAEMGTCTVYRPVYPTYALVTAWTKLHPA